MFLYYLLKLTINFKKSKIKLNFAMSKRQLPIYLIVFVSFLATVLLGSFLLVLPWAHSNGAWGNYIDAFFLSSSAVSITGLSPYTNLGSELTKFGEIIMMILMQIGGLSLITIFTFLLTLSKKKITIQDRYIVKQALSLPSMRGAIKYVRFAFFMTLVFELIGIISFSFVLVPEFGFWEGVYQALFLSVSAFNNAGFDILGSTSLIAYNNNLIINFTVMFLIISGGLGFLVWLDLIAKRKNLSNLSSYSKIVLIMIAILIPTGTLGLFLSQLGHPNSMNFLTSLFLSISSRTGGFTTFDITKMSRNGTLILMILMFFGASPISNGGGIKTTTVFVIFVGIIAYVTGKKPHAFQRTFSKEIILKAMTLAFISLVLVLGCLFALNIFESQNTLLLNHGLDLSHRLFFEIISAFGNTGFSMNTTPFLGGGSKMVLAFLALFGRVGPMSIMYLLTGFSSKSEDAHFNYIEASVPIG